MFTKIYWVLLTCVIFFSTVVRAQEDNSAARASSTRDAIRLSIEDGLDPADYSLARIEQLWNSSDRQEQDELANLLSLGLQHLARDARYGRARSVPDDADLEELYSQISSREDVVQAIQELLPRHRQYLRMKKALADYRAIAANGGWGFVSGKKPILPEETGPRVLELARRLAVTGDLSSQVTPGDIYDLELEAAVKNFQVRHGLPTTGEVHEKTLAALNVPVEQRIQSLLINLERWRWLARDFNENKEAFVNIAGFELFALKEKTIRLRLPVIVGKSYTETPVFSDEIEYIEFNPYWNVPFSIAANEMLPKLRKNPGYLEAEHQRLFPSGDASAAAEISPYSINWSVVAKPGMARYLIRQDPGPWNALGTMKFVFPNSHSVYLHDTPSRKLFDENTRAFSHGCIRVKNPSEFAVFLLDTPEDPWDLARVEALVDTGKNQIVRLPSPVPIHITYRTAWVDLDNTVNFRPDLYGRDAELDTAAGF